LERVVREVGAFDVKNKLAALLDAVVQGEEVIITRRGKPVAKLVPSGAGVDRARALAAVHRVIALRQGITLGDGVTVRELIDEGRR
jgi:prevent-host-death family protein